MPPDRSPVRCPPFQVVSGEALRCRQSPICAGGARLIWAHLPFCALASSRPGAWFRVRTDARMIIRADLDWADIEVIRFVEPPPLDRGEAWRRLAMHVGHRLLLPPGILGTWIRVGSGGRVCAVRVRRVEGARRHQPGASGQRPLAACGRTGRGEGRAGNGFARASGASFSLAATLTLSRCRTRGIRLGSAPSHHADGPISRHPESRSSGGSCAAACADAGRTGGG